MIRVVDRAGNMSVQKVIKPNGTVITYQVVVTDDDAGKHVVSVCSRHSTLLAARAELGKLPKAANGQVRHRY